MANKDGFSTTLDDLDQGFGQTSRMTAAFEADTGDLGRIAALPNEVAESLGPVEILVTNTGGPPMGEALDAGLDDWRKAYESLVLAPRVLAEAVVPGMRERGWGRILNIASDSAVVIPVEMVHYGVTKTALLGVSRGFAKAAAGTGVTVNSVIAGPTHTPGVETFVGELVGEDLPWDQAEAQFMREHRPQSLLQRLIEPPEIGHLVAYLSSDLASATAHTAISAR